MDINMRVEIKFTLRNVKINTYELNLNKLSSNNKNNEQCSILNEHRLHSPTSMEYMTFCSFLRTKR